MASQSTLSKTTITLHWLVAAVILFQLAGGFIMIGKIFSFYPTHKTIGIFALLIIIPRIIWRLYEGWPEPEADTDAAQRTIARTVHWALLMGTLMMPICGMLASGASGNGFGIFNLVSFVARNPSPANPDIVIPYSEFWMNVGYTMHTLVGYSMAFAIGLHFLAAIKHHLFDKNRTLQKMLSTSQHQKPSTFQKDEPKTA